MGSSFGLPLRERNMPFKSEAQRRFMFLNHPKLADEFAAATPENKPLPEHVKKMSDGGEVESDMGTLHGFREMLRKRAEQRAHESAAMNDEDFNMPQSSGTAKGFAMGGP